MTEYKFKQLDAVKFTIDGKQFSGLVVGVSSTELPVVGHMYIVELPPTLCVHVADRYGYPFSCMSVPESSLEKV